MFVEIHFHLLILEEKSSHAFVRWNGYWKKANEDSRRLIETLEDLFEAGISEEFALEMIQDFLFQDFSKMRRLFQGY